MSSGGHLQPTRLCDLKNNGDYLGQDVVLQADGWTLLAVYGILKRREFYPRHSLSH